MALSFGLLPRASLFNSDSSTPRLDVKPKRLAADREYTGMSVGFTFRNDNIVEIQGEKVSLVKDAHLQEISFCKAGAIDKAFGSLVHANGSLKDELPGLPSDSAYWELMRALQNIADSQK
ncbi:hypothetical protein [Bradyrhizobium sp. 17]|uniref:hypothetical protein n=1 Tax=Bradyrhizobium sp. 17 TaxID=2782649 RepID=UPI001FFA4F25|nr:hypothetical protein [Bradyrhizobium sp. 17]MCK1522783.1 hypothetical protein [Bradyrhizobium sp. 17]